MDEITLNYSQFSGKWLVMETREGSFTELGDCLDNHTETYGPYQRVLFTNEYSMVAYRMNLGVNDVVGVNRL